MSEVFMAKRFLGASLVVLALLAGSFAAARGRQDERRAEEERITPAEEQEALLIAEQFVKSFEAQTTPLRVIDELFVKDFDARLRRSELSYLIYLARVEPEVIAGASDEDLRRLYAASLNHMYACAFLYGADMYKQKLKGEEKGNREPPVSELVPPEALAIMKGDPILAELIAEAEREEKSGQTKEPEASAEIEAKEAKKVEEVEIKSLERLRGFTSTLEKVSSLIREQIKTAQGPHNWKELVSALEVAGALEGRERDCEGMCPRVQILGEDFFGAPKGTRLICVNVFMMFHMDLVRIDGRLRILNIYLTGN